MMRKNCLESAMATNQTLYVAELHAQFAETAKPEQAIKANLKTISFGVGE